MADANDNKPRGQMSAYSFFIMQEKETFEKEHPNEEIVFTEFSKKCSEQWKKLSESEKSKFTQMAKEAMKEQVDYIPPENVTDKVMEYDHDRPKRHLSAYFYFCEDQRSKMEEALTEEDRHQRAIEFGRRWTKMNLTERAKYEELSAKDKIRWENEWAIYNEKSKKEEKSQDKSDE